MFNNTRKLKEKQIKGKSHLHDAMDFTAKKFDKYKQETKERKIINNLTEKVSRLPQKLDDLSGAVEKQGQYPRHNCLLLHEYQCCISVSAAYATIPSSK